MQCNVALIKYFYKGFFLSNSLGEKVVKRLHIVLDDKVFEEVKEVKESLKVTWDQFLVLAARIIKNQPKETIEKYKRDLE